MLTLLNIFLLVILFGYCQKQNSGQEEMSGETQQFLSSFQMHMARENCHHDIFTVNLKYLSHWGADPSVFSAQNISQTP